MIDRIFLAVLVVLCCVCAGCGNEFDDTRVRLLTDGVPVRLDSEQVTLTLAQVDCGVDRDLWDPPVRVSIRSAASLHQSARNLGFTDDVSIGEPGYALPYAQVRGDFILRVENIVDTKEGPGEGVRTVLVQLRAKIPHECFTDDLPIMGIRRGQFKQNQPPTLIYKMESDGWHLDHFVH